MRFLHKWRHDKNYLIHEVSLARWVLAFLVLGTFAGAWDIWWHIAIGRESLFIPPHLLIYLSTGLTILAGIYGYLKTRDRLWRHLAIFLLFVPLLAPFDELWHRLYGIEDLSSAMILWSPPHMALGGVFLVGFILVYPLVHNRDQHFYARWLFGGLAMACIFSTPFVFASPFDVYSPYHVWGAYGTVAQGALLAALLLAAERFLHGTGSTTVVMAFFMLLFVIVGGNFEPATGILLPAYVQPPAWIQIGAFMSAAIAMDFFARIGRFASAVIAGSVWAVIYYAASQSFMPVSIGYTTSDAAVATVMAIIGVTLGALVANRFYRYLQLR